TYVHRVSSRSHRRGGLQLGHIPEARGLSVKGVQHAIRTVGCTVRRPALRMWQV
ncbi:hypothetical protein K443DRAFT_686749, partial [Laccaria amethystina LaAM-08-1]